MKKNYTKEFELPVEVEIIIHCFMNTYRNFVSRNFVWAE